MLAVNGRFLHNRYPLGAHRAARGFLAGLAKTGADLDVVVPPGTDGDVGRRTWAPPGAVGLQVWEQALLPAATRRRALLSLANTGPLTVRRQALYLFDVAFHVGPEWFRGFNNTYMRLMLRVARRSALVMTSSVHVRDQLEGLGVGSDRLAVIPPAVDDHFTPAPASAVADVRQRHGLGRPYVLHMGWGDPRKDVDTAVRAHLAANATVEHDLVLLGTPHPYFAPVTRPTAPSVRVLGRVQEGELVPLLSGAAALLYPSLYEGFGLPPLEAAACETPSVVSDIPVLRETVGARATYVAAGDEEGWTQAIVDAVSGRLTPGTPSTWTWTDAGRLLAATLADAGMLDP